MGLEQDRCGLTFGVMFHGILQVLHDPFLTYHVLDLPLVLDIERVVVESLNLALPVESFSPFAILSLVQHAGEPHRVFDGGCELWLLALKLLPQGRVPEDLETHQLRVIIATRAPPGLRGLLLLLLGALGLSRSSDGASSLSHVDGQHVTVGNLELLHGL